MITSYRALSFRYLKKQKKRTILNILAVLMSAALITGTGTIIESVKNQLITSAVKNEGNFHVCFKGINKDQAFIIRNHLKVEQSCSGSIAGFAVLAETGDENIPYRLLRLNRNDVDAITMLQIDRQLIDGRLPEADGEIAVDKTTMKILGEGTAVGSIITLKTGHRKRVSNDSVITSSYYPLSINSDEEDPEEYFEFDGEKSFRITGILSEEFFMSENYSSNAVIYSQLFNPDEHESFNILVLLNDLSNVKSTAEAIASAAGIEHSQILYNERLLNVSGKSLNDDVKKGFAGFNIIVLAIIVTATIAVIYNSFNISLIERISQFGIMRCVGASPAQIREMILGEAGLISLIAVPSGVIVGLTAMKLVFLIVDTLSSMPLFEGIVLVVSVRVIISSIIICTTTVFASAYYPAIKAGGIPAIEAVRSTKMYSHDRIGKHHAAKFKGLFSSFSTVMAFRNISRNRKRFLITLFSMVISVVLFVSFGGMLRLAENLYLISRDNFPGIKIEAESPITKDVYSRLTTIDSVDLLINHAVSEISIIAEIDRLSSYYTGLVDKLPEFERMDNKIIIPGSRIICYGDYALREIERMIQSGDSTGLILVRKAAFRNDKGKKAFFPNSSYQPGGSLTLEINGERTTLPITAVCDDVYYEDFNENEGGIDIIVNEKMYKELTGLSGFNELFIRMKADADKTGLISYLDELTNTRIGYEYIDAQTQAIEMSRESSAINIFFYGFITVIALISCLNILNTISTNLLIRSREFGIIQAVGLDKTGLRIMILKESMIYCGGALIFGSAAGTGLWYLLVKNMSNIRLSVFQVPLKEIGIAAAALVIITLLSGWFPMKKIDNRPIIENIKFDE